ncbi:MAG: hypothetical protein DCC71_15375 [Proteobacteria bacterium]|nr:MAG: hypothetical protein DCC71_15375 [Pseudomonadota bacterium]
MTDQVRAELAKAAAAFDALRPTEEPRTREEAAAAARDALDAGRRLLELLLDAAAPRAVVRACFPFAVELVSTAATVRALAEFRTPGDARTRDAAALRFAHQARELAHRVPLA